MLAALAFAAQSYASSVLRSSVREMISECDLVFEGRVLQVESRMDPHQRGIHTVVTFEVLDVIKGGWPERTIELSFLGGTADGRTLVVAGMKIPKLDENGIFFVESPARDQVHPFYGWDQGRLRLKRSKGGDLNVLTADGVPVIGIEDAPGRSGELSRGVAVGLVVDPDAPAEAGMRVDEFKQILRSWVER